MPIFSFRVQDGRMVRVQAPDQDSASAAARQWAKSNPEGDNNPVTGFLTTAARGVPFLTELGAGYGAALRSATDLAHGHPADFGSDWNAARQQQQAVVDAFKAQHPLASSAATVAGALAPTVASMGLEWAPPPPVERTLMQRAGVVAGKTVKNALTGAAIGGTYGLAEPGTAAQRLQHATDALPTGAAMGAATPLLAAAIPPLAAAAPAWAAATSSAARGVARGVARRADSIVRGALAPNAALAEPLLAEGLPLTPGQRLGGPARAAEDAATNLPILGHAIAGARARGLEALNRAMANHVLAHIGETAPANVRVGDDMVQYIEGRLRNASNTVASMLPSAKPDKLYFWDLRDAETSLRKVPPSMAKSVDGTLSARMNGLDMFSTGKTLDSMSSKLFDYRNQVAQSPKEESQHILDYLDKYNTSLNDLGARINPEYGLAKRAVDRGWQTFVPFRTASEIADRTGGVATPAQFKGVLQYSRPPRGDIGTLRSYGLMSDLADTADRAMGSPPPDKPLSLRNLAFLTLGVDGVQGLTPTAIAAGGLGAAAAPYLAMGRGVANAFEAANPELTQAAVRGARVAAAGPHPLPEPPIGFLPTGPNITSMPAPKPANDNRFGTLGGPPR